MDTMSCCDGIDDPGQVQAFIQDGYGIMNSCQTASDRGDALIRAINEQLGVEGVPGVQYQTASLGEGNASFDFRTWYMNLDGQSLEPEHTEAFTQDQMATMLQVIYHEGRHAEQWFRMARMRAGLGETADQLTSAMDIPSTIAAAAAADPILECNPETNEAEQWNDSVYGSGSQHREDTLDDIDNRYQDYRNLPEESDAWGVEPSVQQEYQRYGGGG
jgi:hypothetical protein